MRVCGQEGQRCVCVGRRGRGACVWAGGAEVRVCGQEGQRCVCVGRRGRGACVWAGGVLLQQGTHPGSS